MAEPRYYDPDLGEWVPLVPLPLPDLDGGSDGDVLTVVDGDLGKWASWTTPPIGPQGPQGPEGPQGPQGDAGVHVGPSAPTDTSLLWVDESDTTAVVQMVWFDAGGNASAARPSVPDDTVVFWFNVPNEPTNLGVRDIWEDTGS